MVIAGYRVLGWVYIIKDLDNIHMLTLFRYDCLSLKHMTCHVLTHEFSSKVNLFRIIFVHCVLRKLFCLTICAYNNSLSNIQKSFCRLVQTHWREEEKENNNTHNCKTFCVTRKCKNTVINHLKNFKNVWYHIIW